MCESFFLVPTRAAVGTETRMGTLLRLLVWRWRWRPLPFVAVPLTGRHRRSAGLFQRVDEFSSFDKGTRIDTKGFEFPLDFLHLHEGRIAHLPRGRRVGRVFRGFGKVGRHVSFGRTLGVQLLVRMGRLLLVTAAARVTRVLLLVLVSRLLVFLFTALRMVSMMMRMRMLLFLLGLGRVHGSGNTSLVIFALRFKGAALARFVMLGRRTGRGKVIIIIFNGLENKLDARQVAVENVTDKSQSDIVIVNFLLHAVTSGIELAAHGLLFAFFAILAGRLSQLQRVLVFLHRLVVLFVDIAEQPSEGFGSVDAHEGDFVAISLDIGKGLQIFFLGLRLAAGKHPAKETKGMPPLRMPLFLIRRQAEFAKGIEKVVGGLVEFLVLESLFGLGNELVVGFGGLNLGRVGKEVTEARVLGGGAASHGVCVEGCVLGERERKVGQETG